MIGGVVARRYAKALFELAAAEGRIEPVGGELARVKAVFHDAPDLPDLLANPAYTRAERKEIAARTLGAQLDLSEHVGNFIGVLIENGRLRGLPEIAARYQEMADEASGRAQVVVRSALPISGADRVRLEEGLSRVTGKQVSVEVEVDPSLIGGLSARVGGLVFDGSIRAQLDALEEELKRAS
ncbi:MAG: ATP synthase F1 subunit delta [Myxococcota bacterium]